MYLSLDPKLFCIPSPSLEKKEKKAFVLLKEKKLLRKKFFFNKTIKKKVKTKYQHEKINFKDNFNADILLV